MFFLTNTANSIKVFLVLYLYSGESSYTPSVKTSCLKNGTQVGRWINENPFWKVGNCSTRSFSKNDTISCLSGRTIYAIGSSIARQMIFGIMELLGAPVVPRGVQKKLCEKHATEWDDACHQNYKNVSVKFLYIQFLDGYNYSSRGGFPYTKNRHDSFRFDTPGPLANKAKEEKFYEEDNCIDRNMSTCLLSFLNNSNDEDILIVSVGLAYSARVNPSKYIDLDRWLTDSAIAFRENIYNSQFKGTIFRVTMSAFSKNDNLKFNPVIIHNNKLLWNLWNTDNNYTKEWYTIDQYAINHGRYHSYSDAVHFPGVLTYATLYQIMNTVCPNHGVDVDYKWH